jgi:hypothetical protein
MDLEQCAAVVEAVRVLGPAMMAEHKAKHAPAPTGAARPAMLVSLTEATHG